MSEPLEITDVIVDYDPITLARRPVASGALSGTRRSGRVMLLFILLLTLSCRGEPTGAGKTRLVFKHGKLFSTPDMILELIDRFERKNPSIEVEDEELPSNTDEQHRFFVVNLEGESADFDVVALDIIWVPEFSRAGWVRPLDEILTDEQRADMFRSTIDAVTWDGHLYAIPWFVGAGVLYYRTDLVSEPPKTWPELARTSERIMAEHPGMRGFIWQGKQYEGLVCNALEYIWAFGGVIEGGTVDSKMNREALRFMRSLIERDISPEFVLTMTEEPSRRTFQDGRAIFHRNWPYAKALLEAEGSPVRGKVGVSTVPGSFATLGGWHLGVNRYSRHPEEAERFVRFLASRESQRAMESTGEFSPAYRSLYREGDPLLPIYESARPRPVTPYYMMISQVLQIEISAIIAGLRSPEEALASAQQQIEHIVEIER